MIRTNIIHISALLPVNNTYVPLQKLNQYKNDQIFILSLLYKFYKFVHFISLLQKLKKFQMYDTAITVFSPNGHLFQVQYAIEAVKKGHCSVGLVTNTAVILAVEKKAITKLQEGRTVKKIVQLDKHIHMAFSGLTADGRILANKARVECQSYRMNYDDNPPIEYISKHIAQTKQKYTQKGGVRPFGISSLIAGLDANGKPHLYYTDPSGSFSEWKAQACGRNSKQVSQYLQKHYKEGLSNEDGTKLVVKALLDVVQSGNKNIELMMITQNDSRFLTEDQIEKLIESTKQ